MKQQFHSIHNPFAPVVPRKDILYYVFWFFSYLTAPVLLPIKLLSAVLMGVLATIGMKVLSRELNVEKPMHLIRRALVQRWIQFFAHLMLTCLGYLPVKEVNVHLKPNFDTAYIAVSNHVNSLDPIHYLRCGFQSFAAKEEIRQFPFFGIGTWILQGIFIPRRGKQAAERAAQKILSRTQDDVHHAGLPRKFPMLLLFVEGTTVNQTALLPFKRGAFQAGKPVALCSIRYNRFRDSSDASEKMFKAQMMGLLMLFNRVTIEYFGEYHPNEEEQANPELYAQNVRNLYAEKLGWTRCDYSRSDKVYFMGNSDDYSKCSEAFKTNFGPDVRRKNGWCVHAVQ